jgi:hypothetical protein
MIDRALIAFTVTGILIVLLIGFMIIAQYGQGGMH